MTVRLQIICLEHTETDKTKLDTIGLWWEKDSIVGAAIYDMYYGEAFCRANKLGAKKAFVISDMDFYGKLGFVNEARFSFYWKYKQEEEICYSMQWIIAYINTFKGQL